MKIWSRQKYAQVRLALAETQSALVVAGVSLMELDLLLRQREEAELAALREELNRRAKQKPANRKGAR